MPCPPEAVIYHPPDNSTFRVNRPVLFCSAGSCDHDGILVNWIWRFEKDGALLAEENHSFENFTRSFAEVGRYRITLRVIDDDGLEDSATIYINIVARANEAPVAVISSPPDNSTFKKQTSVTFEPSGSYDSDGAIVEYLWNTELNGEPVHSSAKEKQPGSFVVTFTDPGRYLVTLTVTDDEGSSNSTSIFINIVNELPRPPVAVISQPERDSIFFVNEAIEFRSNGTYDPDGESFSCLWSFGDGKCAAGDAALHTYNPSGKYMVSLTVMDSGGLSSTTALELRIVSNALTPSIIITSPKEGDEFIVNETVHFNARTFLGKNETNLTIQWFFTDAGMPRVTHSCQWRYDHPGRAYATAYLFDDAYGRADDTVTFTIRPPEYSQRWPVAFIGFPRNGNTYEEGSLVPFHGGGYDYDGEIVDIVWRIEREGLVVAEERPPIPNFTRILHDVGQYIINLMVTDNEGLKSSDCVVVNVVPKNSKPEGTKLHPVIIVPEGQPFVKLTDGLLTAPTAQVIYFDSGGVNDSVNLTHWWVFGDRYPPSGSSTARDFSAPGNYTLTLLVFNGDMYGSAGLDIRVFEHPMRSLAIVVPGGQENVSSGGGRITVKSGSELRLECSVEPGEFPITYRWDFGDGTEATGSSVVHIYTKPGRYYVRCALIYGNCYWETEVLVEVESSAPVPQAPAIAPPPPHTFAVLWAVVATAIGAALFIGGTELGLRLLSPVLAFIYSRTSRGEVQDNSTRQRIYSHIVDNPGDGYRVIKDALGLGHCALAHHLKILEGAGMVRSRTDGLRIRFYPSEMRVPEPPGGASSGRGEGDIRPRA